MQRHRYKFSHEHLDFVKVRRSIWHWISRYSLYFLGSIALAVVYYVIFAAFFYTPEERGLLRENKLLTEQYNELTKNFGQVEKVLSDIGERDNQIYQTIFQTTPLSTQNTEDAGRYEELNSHSNAELAATTNKLLQALTAQAKTQSALLNTIITKLQQEKTNFETIPAIQPIKNKDLSRTGSSVGMRIHPYYKVLTMHTGIDFVAATGVNVMATANGTVTEVSRSLREYGNKIVIDHGNGYSTVYAHLHSFDVGRGQKVKRGQVIGTVGNTGQSTTPHLHYEIVKNGEYKDPLNYFFMDLTPSEYERMVLLATNSGQSLD